MFTEDGNDTVGAFTRSYGSSELGGQEGAFLICTFRYGDALTHAGRAERRNRCSIGCSLGSTTLAY